MAQTTSEEREAEREKTRRSLLAAEAAALLLLRKRLRNLPVPRNAVEAAQAAEWLRVGWSRDTYESIRLTRQKAAQRLVSELAGYDVELAASAATGEASAAFDAARARKAGRWLSDRWSRRVGASLDLTRDTAKAARVASTKTASDLVGVASYENGTAFNAERRAMAWGVTETRLVRVWDAKLDKRTCPTCSGLDGTIVDVGETFPGGANPGSVHGRCRCIDVLVPAEFSRLTGAKAA